MADPTLSGTALTTLIGLTGGAIGWFLKDRIEASRVREERLHEKRVQLYAKILEPILAPFTDPGGPKGTENLKKLATPEYRESGFQLALMGSDDVVRGWNDFMQYLYNAEERGGFDLKTGLKKLGGVLLQIRRSLGEKQTKLSEFDMLRWLVKDLDELS